MPKAHQNYLTSKYYSKMVHAWRMEHFIPYYLSLLLLLLSIFLQMPLIEFIDSRLKYFLNWMFDSIWFYHNFFFFLCIMFVHSSYCAAPVIQFSISVLFFFHFVFLFFNFFYLLRPDIFSRDVWTNIRV